VVRLVRSCLLEGKRRATTPPVHVGDLPIVLVHHLEVCLPDAIDCQVHLAQEERAVCLRGLLVLDRIDDPIPVVHQQVIFKEPDLYLQIIIFLEQLLLILLLDLLLRLILDLPHTTVHTRAKHEHLLRLSGNPNNSIFKRLAQEHFVKCGMGKV